MKRPDPLKPGDRIYLLSPAGAVEKEYVEGAARRLNSWGLKPIVGTHACGKAGRFSGTEQERLSDLNTALSDPSVKAILCCRGGYGTIQLLDKINRTAMLDSAKWIIGYSDITALHAWMQQQAEAVSIHGPMAKHLTLHNESDPAVATLKKILFGGLPLYETESHPLNRTGEGKGVLRGGNLAMLYALRGTPYDFGAEEAILFIEDIGERPYQVERMLYNFKHGGIFDRIAGLIVGSFTDYEPDLSMSPIPELIRQLVDPYLFPVCFDFPVGHTERNVPLICGDQVTLTVNQSGTTLRFGQ